MKTPLYLVLFCWSIYIAPLGAQTIFKTGWRKADPIAYPSELGLEEKVKIHQAFLDQATRENDPLKRLYGFSYLFKDYFQAHDFTEATRYLLEVETLAKTADNPGWQGWGSHLRGNVLVRLQKNQESIAAFERAAQLCGTAGDSLCLAESLEQLGAAYSLTNDFEKANRYYDQALPLIAKYGDLLAVSTCLNNFGGLLCRQGRPAEAIPYLERAINNWRQLARQKEEAQASNNLGECYYELGQMDKAIKIFNQCVRINQQLNLPEFLVNNYSGLHNVYEKQGNLRSALDFLGLYYNLRDSIIGAQTQMNIADLESKYHAQQKEAALQKTQAELANVRLSLERGVLILVAVMLLVVFVIWRWRFQMRRAQKEEAQNKVNLSNMTRILLEKNARLLSLEEQLNKRPSVAAPTVHAGDFEQNLYNQRILTDEDWSAFKVYFEKVYPGYIQRLKAAHPNISDAEMRLFLFIKLDLSRKEAAAILGISVDSVKKTRSRLRKRLDLEEDQDLDEYIRVFNA